MSPSPSHIGQHPSRLAYLRKSRGSIIFETIGTIALLSLIGITLLALQSQSNDERKAEVAAVYHKRVSQAATEYVSDHYQELLQELPAAGDKKAISFATLKGEGLIPATLADKNIWGQTPTLRVVRGPGSEQLEALVIGEGGQTISQRVARLVARAIGAEGGYTVAQGQYCGTTLASTDLLCGTQGVWSRPVTDFGASSDPGHVSSALFFLDGAAVSDYLYRKRVPGKPELNTMETYLQMGAGAIAQEGEPCYSVAGDPSSLLLNNGAIATTADGMILSCQSGVWEATGGSPAFSDVVLLYESAPPENPQNPMPICQPGWKSIFKTSDVGCTLQVPIIDVGSSIFRLSGYNTSHQRYYALYDPRIPPVGAGQLVASGPLCEDLSAFPRPMRWTLNLCAR